MAIANKFLYFSTVAAYNTAKGAGNIANGSIVFVNQAADAEREIEAQRFIATHGVEFHANQAADSIKAAIEALDVTNLVNSDAAARGVTITLNEVDGKVTSLAISDLAGAILGTYTKGDSHAAIASGDTIAQALSKLENQIENAMAGLDSEITAGDDKYFTGIKIVDGQLQAVGTGGSASANVDTAKVLDYVESNSATAQDIATTDTIAQALAKVKRNVEVEAAARATAISGLNADAITAGDGEFIKSISESAGVISATTAEMPTVAAISATGQAIVSVSQTKGTVSATAGDIASAHVTYTPQGEEGSEDTTNTNVQDVLAEIFEKIADNEAAGTVTVEKNGTVVNAIAADGDTYTIKQGTTTVATINIARDMVVSAGTVITADGTEKNGTDASAVSAGLTSGEKYIRLTIANGDVTANLIYIPVNDLYKDHTVQENAPKIQLAISASNVISATIVSGSIEKTDLVQTLQNEITSARTTITEIAQTDPASKHILVTKTTGTGSTADNYVISENDIASAASLAQEITDRQSGDATLLGENTDASTANTIYGAKKGVEEAKAAAAAAHTVVNAKATGHVTVAIDSSAADGHAEVTVSESDIASAQLVGTLPGGVTATTVVGYAAEVASNEADAAEAAAKSYADDITVNGKDQTSQAITIDGADIALTGYTAKTGAGSGDVAATDTVNAAIKKVETKVDNLDSASPFEYASGKESSHSTVLKGENLSANNEGELAIGKYNSSSTDANNASGRTAFSVGNGTAANALSNAFEVRENGDIYINISAAYSKLQDILANEINWYEG